MIPPRLSHGQGLEIRDIRRDFSNFEHVDGNYRPDSKITNRQIQAVRRLFSQARSSKARTMVIEPLPAEGLIADENIELRRLFPKYSMDGLRRLSFWTCPDEVVQRNQHLDKHLIGYAVLKLDTIRTPSGQVAHQAWHVFESVIGQQPLSYAFVPRPREYALRIGARNFKVSGSLYCQHNGLNKACAQVALRSLLAHRLEDSDISYSRINKIAGKVRRFHPKKGLDAEQIMRVLEELKITYTSLNLQETPKFRKRYHDYLYAGIESGEGALLGFRLKGPDADERHIMPFFGHTFNPDTWLPYAEQDYFHVGDTSLKYISSGAWTGSFIGHDGLGSNYCVPRLYIPPAQVDFIAVLHRDGFPSHGVRAEVLALDYLDRCQKRTWPSGPGSVAENSWLLRLRNYVGERQAVFRALPVTREEYLAHLRAMRDWRGNRESNTVVEAISQHLPQRLWMIEVSIPELFPLNKRKIGCIILDGSKPLSKDRDFGNSFVYARLPEQYIFFVGADRSGTENFRVDSSNLKSHVRVLER